jgi:GTP-binding protein
MITNYLLFRENLTHIFILIDSRIAPQEIDLAFIKWIYGNRKPFSLVFTKTDKTSQKEASHNLKQFMLALSQTISYMPPYYMTSGIKPQSTQ